MSVRPATSADLPLLASLHAGSFSEVWGEAALGELMAMPGSIALVAEDGSGFVLIRAAGGEAEVLTLAVEPAARRRGTALKLMQEALRLAEVNGASVMFLEVAVSNTPAIALYKRLGFDEVGRRPSYYSRIHGKREDALVLRVLIPLPRVGI